MLLNYWLFQLRRKLDRNRLISRRKRPCDILVSSHIDVLEDRTLLSVALPLDTELLVNESTQARQHEPAVAQLADGYVAAWTSAGQGKTGSGERVLFRRFDSDGTPLGGELFVIQTNKGNQREPSLADLGRDEFVVVWSGSGAGDRNGVFARRFDVNGTAIGSEILVNETVSGNQQRPSVVRLSEGGFVVAWEGNGVDDAHGAFIRRFDSDGVPMGGELLVNETINGDQQAPSIARLADDRFVLTWSGKGDVKCFNGSGTKAGLG